MPGAAPTFAPGSCIALSSASAAPSTSALLVLLVGAFMSARADVVASPASCQTVLVHSFIYCSGLDILYTSYTVPHRRQTHKQQERTDPEARLGPGRRVRSSLFPSGILFPPRLDEPVESEAGGAPSPDLRKESARPPLPPPPPDPHPNTEEVPRQTSP